MVVLEGREYIWIVHAKRSIRSISLGKDVFFLAPIVLFKVVFVPSGHGLVFLESVAKTIFMIFIMHDTHPFQHFYLPSPMNFHH